MAKVPAVHREARFSGIRVAVSTEKSVLPDTPTSRKSSGGRLHKYLIGNREIELEDLKYHGVQFKQKLSQKL